MTARCCFALLLIAATASAREVRVAGTDGAPVAGARAWVTRPGAVEAIPLDASGLALLPDTGLDAACVTAPGHRPVALSVTALAAPETVVLQRGETVSGSLRSAGGGAPIDAGILRLHGDEALGPCARQAITDAKGAWTLSGLPRQTVAIDLMQAPGHVLPEPQRILPGSGRRLELRLHPAALVTLTITGADGKPLAGAEARLLPDWRRRPLDPPEWTALRESVGAWRGISDATGAVALPPLPWREWRIAVTHRALAPASVTAAARKPRVEARLALGIGGTFTLRAVGEDGAPLAAAVARVVPVEGEDLELAEPSPPSAADGLVRLARVPPGRLAIDVSAPGMRPTRVAGQSSAHGAVVEIGDVMLQPGVPIAGRVTSGGAAVASVEVTLRGEGAERASKLTILTDASGAFRFEGLEPESRATLEAEAPGHVKWTRARVIAGTTDVEAELERAASLALMVLAAGTREPLDGATATLSTEMDYAGGGEPKSDPAEPALLRFAGLRAGEYSASVSAPGRVPATRSPVVVAVGAEQRIEVELKEGRVVTGQVVDATQRQPVGGAALSALGRRWAPSDSEGRFVLDGLDGALAVTADHPAFLPQSLQVDPDALPPEGLVIALQRGAAVEGVVHGPNREPLPGAVVSAQSSGRSASTDEQGAYRIDGLKPGATSLVKMARPGSANGRESVRVDLVAGKTARVDFGMGARMHGRVTSRGQALQGVQVSLMQVALSKNAGQDDLHVPTAVAVTDAEGHYELGGVVEGRHVMQLGWRSRRIARDVTMPAGVRDHLLDVEFPELHLAGIVIDGETREPVTGAHVTLTPMTPEGRSASSSQSMVSHEDGSSFEIHLTNAPGSSDTTGADGRFHVPVAAPGTWRLGTWSADGQASEQMDVTASRDDIVLVRTKKDQSRGKLRVRLLDATTGAALPGKLAILSKQGSMINGGSASQNLGLTDDMLPLHAAGWVTGYGMRVEQVTAEDVVDGNAALDLLLAPGGSLRLMLPAGALPGGMSCRPKGALSLVLASGFDVGFQDINFCMNYIAAASTTDDEGAWIIRDLPPGALTVKLGEGPAHAVDIVAGQTTELDLR